MLTPHFSAQPAKAKCSTTKWRETIIDTLLSLPQEMTGKRPPRTLLLPTKLLQTLPWLNSPPHTPSGRSSPNPELKKHNCCVMLMMLRNTWTGEHMGIKLYWANPYLSHKESGVLSRLQQTNWIMQRKLLNFKQNIELLNHYCLFDPVYNDPNPLSHNLNPSSSLDLRRNIFILSIYDQITKQYPPNLATTQPIVDPWKIQCSWPNDWNSVSI